MQIILGSNSPRRLEILNFFSLAFKQIASEFEESQVVFQGDPAAFVQEIARGKALSLIEKHPEEIILTADTTVFLAPRIFLKPKDLKEAHAMLRALSGKEHEVFTGVCVTRKGKLFLASEKTRVFFHELTEEQIRMYLSICSPLDKAGGYAIQKGGSLIVKRIEGCYYNAMGLPIHTMRRQLLEVGVDLWNYLKSI